MRLIEHEISDWSFEKPVCASL